LATTLKDSPAAFAGCFSPISEMITDDKLKTEEAEAHA